VDQTPHVVIDPRGLTAPTSMPVYVWFPLREINLPGISTAALADSIFLWHDDLNLCIGEGKHEPDERQSADCRCLMPWAISKLTANFSWFPNGGSASRDERCNRSVPSKHQHFPSRSWCAGKRKFDTAVGEAVVSNVTCDNSPGYGGIGIAYSGSTITPKQTNGSAVQRRSNQSRNQPSDVVSRGFGGTDTTVTSPPPVVTLVAPIGTAARARSGTPTRSQQQRQARRRARLTGVYTTSVELDNDEIWTK